MILKTLCALILTTALLAHAPTAEAGHYRLPLEGLISQSETDLLKKAGVLTTLALLDQVKTPAQRKRLAAKTGLDQARVDALARHVDLLRIDGIGPTMVRLLDAAGVRHSRALGAESAAALLARMTSVNAGVKIANVLPPEGQVAAWVAAAKQLPAALDGLD